MVFDGCGYYVCKNDTWGCMVRWMQPTSAGDGIRSQSSCLTQIVCLFEGALRQGLWGKKRGARWLKLVFDKQQQINLPVLFAGKFVSFSSFWTICARSCRPVESSQWCRLWLYINAYSVTPEMRKPNQASSKRNMFICFTSLSHVVWPASCAIFSHKNTCNNYCFNTYGQEESAFRKTVALMASSHWFAISMRFAYWPDIHSNVRFMLLIVIACLEETLFLLPIQRCYSFCGDLVLMDFDIIRTYHAVQLDRVLDW